MSLERWLSVSAKPLSSKSEKLARVRQSQLTKPPGSLGRLENVAIRLAAMQGRVFPTTEKVAISVFAADHGVAASGVSAFPQEVTSQMILNFASGGAAIAVLAKQLGASFEVVNLGTVVPVEHPDVVQRIIASQTADFSAFAAISEEQLDRALSVGAEAIDRAHAQGVEIFIAGEMGIGNTTSASALLACSLSLEAAEVTGPGTGITGSAMEHKTSVIQRAVKLHKPFVDSPLELLRRLGGFEIAAMVGAYLRAAEVGIAMVIDGFISTAAAYISYLLCPELKKWMIFGHASAEPFHKKILAELDAEPLLQLDMRLGEGSGAAVAVGLIQQACLLHNTMATFADAGVSDKEG